MYPFFSYHMKCGHYCEMPFQRWAWLKVPGTIDFDCILMSLSSLAHDISVLGVVARAFHLARDKKINCD